MTEPDARRRAIALVLAALALVPALVYFVGASIAVARVTAIRSSALLAVDTPAARAALASIGERQIETAIEAQPLDQRIANVAMVRDVRRHGPARQAAWLAGIARLGWRDTMALQNLLYAAANRGDVAGLVDVSDALLRRGQLVDQIVPVLSIAELDPAMRTMLARRIAANASWRGVYLTMTGYLKDASQLSARFALLGSITRQGGKLTHDEAIANIKAFDRSGMPQLGFALWQQAQPGVTRPIDDPNFARASRDTDIETEAVPYQWQLMSGDGFHTEALLQDARPTLSIEWDGRGVPLFAQQRTSARSGYYKIVAHTARDGAGNLAALSFRLRCADAVTTFHQDAPASNRYIADGLTACDYPTLMIAGNVQPSAVPHTLNLERISLHRVAAGGGRP